MCRLPALEMPCCPPGMRLDHQCIYHGALSSSDRSVTLLQSRHAGGRSIEGANGTITGARQPACGAFDGACRSCRQGGGRGTATVACSASARDRRYSADVLEGARTLTCLQLHCSHSRRTGSCTVQCCSFVQETLQTSEPIHQYRSTRAEHNEVIHLLSVAANRCSLREGRASKIITRNLTFFMQALNRLWVQLWFSKSQSTLTASFAAASFLNQGHSCCAGPGSLSAAQPTAQGAAQPHTQRRALQWLCEARQHSCGCLPRLGATCTKHQCPGTKLQNGRGRAAAGRQRRWCVRDAAQADAVWCEQPAHFNSGRHAARSAHWQPAAFNGRQSTERWRRRGPGRSLLARRPERRHCAAAAQPGVPPPLVVRRPSQVAKHYTRAVAVTPQCVRACLNAFAPFAPTRTPPAVLREIGPRDAAYEYLVPCTEQQIPAAAQTVCLPRSPPPRPPPPPPFVSASCQHPGMTACCFHHCFTWADVAGIAALALSWTCSFHASKCSEHVIDRLYDCPRSGRRRRQSPDDLSAEEHGCQSAKRLRILAEASLDHCTAAAAAEAAAQAVDAAAAAAPIASSPPLLQQQRLTQVRCCSDRTIDPAECRIRVPSLKCSNSRC